MSTPRLSETSYAVLGLLEQCGPSTPYQLKQIAQESIFHFWSIPHTQLYTECARLAQAGLLEEEQEQHGRRRRVLFLGRSYWRWPMFERRLNPSIQALDRQGTHPETCGGDFSSKQL